MKKRIIHLFLFILLCPVLIIYSVGCNKPEASTNAKELMIFAAAGTKPVMDEASKLFEQKYGIKISVNYGGGGEVLSNMVISRTGDIYVAPEQKFMDSARKKGAIVPDATIYSLAYMIPVIGVRKGNPLNIQSLADFAKPNIRVVMGNSETMLLGEMVPQMLQKAGLYDAVKPNIITHVPQVTSMITALKAGQVDACVIWHNFGTTSSDDIDIIWIPREYVTGIGEIQAAVSTYSQELKTAEEFINLLVSFDGKYIFKKNGYIVDRQEAGKYWLANY